MQCPTGETSSFFYKSKLNCLNFTIVEMLKKTATVKKRNKNEKETDDDIGAYGNVYSYFWDEFILYAVTCFENIHTITHKYLIKGHTQNVHSLIEKEIKKNKKSGPIYAPYQYLTHDFFVDLTKLQENWGYNYNEDEQKKSVLWNNVKVLKFCEREPFAFYYKTSYSQSEFTMVNIRNKRKKKWQKLKT
ncbi:hypothetical protein ABMA28_003591 [Loxostege sticticalis]|uniref:Uncharacterized protein n=1 Tax=Loxostege sticticalis TaxID=481309 RepID=A0ABD0SWJ8_LOXSC